ncbi:glycosyltransferase family 4 protein [Alcaligenes faecalis subsp. phenolicus]|uniref:glycosyltransferase family 4 protein n=1 Tax=Alcaligenes nematophilus TaxID=2994643 RepID=UPI002AA44E76|nr:glycosyltransferase family 4 protein [Alcaligenes phenolicus]
MKILYLITRGDEIGGAGIHVLDLAEQMQRRKHDVLVLAGGKEGKLFDRARQRGIPIQTLADLVHPINIKSDYHCIRQLREILKQVKPDLLHSHSSKAGAIGRVAARLAGVPSVFTAHGWAFTEGVSKKKRALYLSIEYGLAFFAKKIITVSQYDKDLALHYRFPHHKLQVIHNGVVNQNPRLPPRTTSREMGRPVRLLMVARFSQQKDHNTLLKALSLISSLNWRLDLLGTGETLDQTQELSRRLNLSEKVCFHGASDNVNQHLLEADVFVLSTNWEGLPLSILEAMSAGLPIVATDVGGVAECVKHQHNGYLVPRQNPQALAHHLTTLIEQDNIRHCLGVAARQDFLAHFTVDAMVDKTEKLYLDCLARSKSR